MAWTDFGRKVLSYDLKLKTLLTDNSIIVGLGDIYSDEIERLRRYEHTVLPADFDFASVDGLSNEVKQKLQEARPDTLARAGRIPGVTPAAISLLMVHLKKTSAAS